jgi:uncharacterized membrane-anchored protein
VGTVNTVKKLVGSIVAGYTLFLLLAAVEYVGGTLNDSTLLWISVLSAVYSIVSFVFSNKWYDGIVNVVLVPAFAFFLLALLLIPISPLLLVGTVMHIMSEGPTIGNILCLLLSATSFFMLISIIHWVLDKNKDRDI